MEPRLSQLFVNTFSQQTPPWGFDGLGYFVYKRTYARRLDEHTTEEWWQTCQRVVNGLQSVGAGYTEDELERLYAAFFFLKALPAGRMLWQLGTPNVERHGGDSLCNCWFTTVTSPKDFGFIFDELMLGGGVGFSIDPSGLPPVGKRGAVQPRHESDADLIVSDKREGWVRLLEETLEAYLGNREPFDFSTQLVRPKGAPIKTFGGVASGPQVLEDGIMQISRILDTRYNQRLRSVDVLDIANIIGSVVVSGNVRRSAQIALGDAGDSDFLQAKRWDRGDIPAWRAMSNNSVYVEDISDVPSELWEGYAGNGEPYGLFNLHGSREYGRSGEHRPDETIEGVNPCAEIPLASWESCNLAEVFLPNVDTAEEFRDLSRLLYKGQKAIAALPYRRRETTEIVNSNMRLGLSVSGVAQAGERRLGWLDSTYQGLREFDREWSRYRGWPESVRLTTVKPSGTLSLLAGVTPGVHPGFSEHHVRRVRVAHNDPLVEVAQRDGYPVEPMENLDGTRDDATLVVSFPCRFPSQTLFAEDTTAIDQLELSNRLQREWVDNSVSCTVYYDDSELGDVQAYLRASWPEMKSVSFLRRENHGFVQAPLEAITAGEYQALRDNVHRHPVSDLGDEPITDECNDGACPIR